MSNSNIVVPASIINNVKEGLIKLGYATEATDPTFVQDCYFKWVIINQTGFNPNMPYAIDLLPKAIQQALGGTTPVDPTEPEVPDDGSMRLVIPSTEDYNSLLNQMRSGAWEISTPEISGADSIIRAEHARITTSQSRGLIIEDLDPSCIQNDQGDSYIISHVIPMIVELKNVDQAQIDDMLAGTSQSQLYMRQGDTWVPLPTDALGSLVIVHPTTGKFYIILAIQVVAKPYQPISIYNLALDQDGDGTEFDRIAVDLTPRLGNILGDNKPKLVVPSASDLMQLYSDLYNGVWDGLANTANNPQGLTMLDPQAFSVEHLGGVIRATPIDVSKFTFTASSTTVQSGHVIPTIFELQNTTSGQIDAMLDGTTSMVLYLKSKGVQNALPKERYAQLLTQHPVSNKWYMVVINDRHTWDGSYSYATSDKYTLDPEADGVTLTDTVVASAITINEAYKP